MISVVAIRRDGRWMGHSFVTDRQEVSATSASDESDNTASVADPVLTTNADGSIVVNTTTVGKDIMGYASPVPLEIVIKDDKVQSVKALDNTETPAFFASASSLLTRWDGLAVDEALQLDVDVVSGATFSSKAIIANVQAGLMYAQNQRVHHSIWRDFDISVKALVGLLVALMAAILPLFIHNKVYRIIQQLLNVGVLGFWCGQFISYSSLIGYVSNGMNIIALIVPFILLLTAFIYPLFGKKSYYCTNVCPFGSLQELAGRCVRRKLTIRPATVHRLDLLRQWLWAALMLCLWTGLWFDWINYEPFSAFIVQSASWVAIVIAVVFVLLSLVVVRPYCRFVCPMGTLFRIGQTGRTK